MRKSATVTDATVTLNLNGNRLTSIVDGSRMLVRGKDTYGHFDLIDPRTEIWGQIERTILRLLV